jgi:GntR family transcriptional regulator
MPIAPYQRVVAEIRQRIASGEWPPGYRIPSRAHLAEDFHVSDASARRGMAVLRNSGELEGTQRSRLFVAHPPAVRTLIEADADWPYLTGDGGGTGSCTASPDLAQRLGVKAGRRLRWERIECLDPDSRPSHLVTSWWVGHRVGAWVTSEAVAELHQLTSEEATNLGLVAGVPAWLIQRTRYDVTGRPVETADLVLPADRWRVRLR